MGAIIAGDVRKALQQNQQYMNLYTIINKIITLRCHIIFCFINVFEQAQKLVRTNVVASTGNNNVIMYHAKRSHSSIAAR